VETRTHPVDMDAHISSERHCSPELGGTLLLEEGRIEHKVI
jgi:hypothetical protein